MEARASVPLLIETDILKANANERFEKIKDHANRQ